jgi:hypothetical protein
MSASVSAADAFGGRHVSAGEFRRDATLDPDAVATRLDKLARRGLQVAVEAFPRSVLGGPTAIPELLRRVQSPTVGS